MRYVETLDVPVAELAEYPGNARLHATTVLEDSAKVNGQYRSIIARRRPAGELEILAGHGTRAAFAAIGAATVRVEVIEADDAEAARIVLVDNRGADLASYDDAGLMALLASLGDDLAGTGFDPAAAADLEAMLNAPVSLAEADEWTDEDSDTAGMGRIDLRVPKDVAARFLQILSTYEGETDGERLAALLDFGI